MFIDSNQKRINIYAQFTSADGVTHANLLDPVVREANGITEIPDPVPPADFDPTYWTVMESDDAPYITYTKKDDATCNAIWNERIDQQIDSMEGKYPRAMRELMMLYFVDKAVAAGIDPVDLLDPSKPAFAPGYAKVKQLDDQIAALRASKKK